MMQQLIDAALHVQDGSRATRAHAPLHRVERDGGIQAERERFHEPMAVHAPYVRKTRLCPQQLGARLVNLVRDAQRARVIVARPYGYHAERRPPRSRAPHEPARHLVDDAVAAQRDHRRAAFGALGDLGGVPRPRRASEHDRVLPQLGAQQPDGALRRSRPVAVLSGRVRDEQDGSLG